MGTINGEKHLAARLAHEANRVYCELLGDMSQPKWDDAPLWQKQSALTGVEFMWSGEKTPEDAHNNWMSEKLRDGWRYGPVKIPVIKEHPCILPYADLPAGQKVKDYIFRSIVLAVKAAWEAGVRCTEPPSTKIVAGNNGT